MEPSLDIGQLTGLGLFAYVVYRLIIRALDRFESHAAAQAKLMRELCGELVKIAERQSQLGETQRDIARRLLPEHEVAEVFERETG